jgi:histidinol-phosphate aminotransferase
VGGDAAAFARRLHDEGVAVRPLGAWGAPNYIRVTIGTAEQNQAFLSAARQLGSGNPTPGFEGSSSAP